MVLDATDQGAGVIEERSASIVPVFESTALEFLTQETKRFSDTEGTTLNEFVESVIQWSVMEFGKEEIVAARENHFMTDGKVFHTDDFFELRIDHFLNHFFLTRRLSCKSHHGEIPIQVLRDTISTYSIQISSELKAHLDSLENYIYSVFEISKLDTKRFIVRDLMSHAKYFIRNVSCDFPGLKKGDIVQAYLFMDASTSQKTQFGTFRNSLVPHPSGASTTIKKYLKKSQKQLNFSRNSLLSRLSKQFIRYQRHPHVDCRIIYAADPR